MQRDIVQDVVPPERKSIRDIPLPNNKPVSMMGGNGSNDPRGPVEPPHNNISFRRGGGYLPRRSSGGKNKWWFIVGAIILVAFITFGILSFFGATIITVTPKQETTAVSTTIQISKTATTDAVIYKTVNVTGENGKVVPAITGGHVDTKASGTLTVYNNYSNASIDLVAKTRFQSPDGLIFRIKNPVTVPGLQTNSTGTKVPGTIDVTVYADQTGEAYNIGPAKFTIPGLKGDPQYNSVYAESKASMAGGYSGNAMKVVASVSAQAKTDIENNLQKQLLAQVRSTTPSDYILLPNATKTTFEDMPQTNMTATSVQMNMRLILQAVIFNKADLTNAVLKSVAPDAVNKSTITNLDQLTYNIPDIASLGGNNPESIDVSGQVNIIWNVPVANLQKAFAGKKSSDLANILTNFPAIQKAKVTLRPFWRFSFPGNPNDITIRTVDGK